MSDKAHSEHAREQLVRRIESFSDIVIGFSLAQLGLSLVIPQHAAEFVQKPGELFAFILTFTIIVRFWWTHFKVFRSFFEPNRLMITCNFMALAALSLQVFALQLYLSFVPKGEGLTAARIYFSFFAAAYGFLGLMFVLGSIFRWRALSAAQRRAGLRDICGIFGAVSGCIVGNIRSTSDAMNIEVGVGGSSQMVANLPIEIFLYTVGGWLIGLIAGRVVPKFWPRRQALSNRRGADVS